MEAYSRFRAPRRWRGSLGVRTGGRVPWAADRCRFVGKCPLLERRKQRRVEQPAEPYGRREKESERKLERRVERTAARIVAHAVSGERCERRDLDGDRNGEPGEP